MSDITFHSIQQVFEQAFYAERKIPDSVTLSETDYKAFCESMFPKREASAFERDLLGEDAVNKFEQQRTAYQRCRVTHILDYVTGGMIPITFSSHMPSGKIFIEWSKARGQDGKT